MRSHPSCLQTLIGTGAPWALALAVLIALPANQAQAQAGRVSLNGYVAPRCWMAPATVGPASERLPSAARAGAASVRCSDRALQVYVEQVDTPPARSGAPALGVIGSPSGAPATRTVIISPRG